MLFKYKLISILILFFSLISEAQVYIWPAILKARAERNEEQSIELRSNQWPSFGLSYVLDRYIFNFEKSSYNTNSDNGNVSIETQYSDSVLGFGYSLFQYDASDFYAVVSTGFYQQKIKSTVGSLSTTNRSEDKSLIGIGAEYLLRTPTFISLTVGGRFNWTEDLEPEIMPELYFKIGLYF